MDQSTFKDLFSEILMKIFSILRNVFDDVCFLFVSFFV